MTITDEVKALSRELRKRKGPLKVTRVELEPGVDSTGDPMLTVWILFPDGTPDSVQTFENVRPLKDHAREILHRMGEPRWALVRFRTESEYEQMVEE